MEICVPPLPSNIRAAALTDVGLVRANNEDAFACDPATGLFVVCDGMGGAAAGEVASHIASTTVVDVFASHSPEAPTDVRLINAIRAANAAVLHAGLQAHQQGMGTTLVAAHIFGTHLTVANVGDSRAYLLPRDGTWTLLTSDHSYINQLIQSGDILPSDEGRPELRRFGSLITRAISAAEDVEPDLFPLDLHDGDTILLASDGLTRYLDVPDFHRLIDPADLELSCRRLIDTAKSMGGIDNISCLLIHYRTP